MKSSVGYFACGLVVGVVLCVVASLLLGSETNYINDNDSSVEFGGRFQTAVSGSGGDPMFSVLDTETGVVKIYGQDGLKTTIQTDAVGSTMAQ
ncbi:MAG: hypothetical protein K1Y02_21405 [Candidatus Hydrogenedentes bacterium]|nr:hypothetical protein [Candidatus Hydrogenedentota bacterium]